MAKTLSEEEWDQIIEHHKKRVAQWDEDMKGSDERRAKYLEEDKAKRDARYLELLRELDAEEAE